MKEIIGSIIEQEDSSKPLSDRKIVDLLADKDQISRRTVAIQEELSVPHKPSSALLDGIRMDSLPRLGKQVTPEAFDAKSR